MIFIVHLFLIPQNMFQGTNTGEASVHGMADTGADGAKSVYVD